MTHHLAQINIGRLIAPVDDAKIAEFVAQLDPVNALADTAPGFVWRLESSSGNPRSRQNAAVDHVRICAMARIVKCVSLAMVPSKATGPRVSASSSPR